MSKLIKRFSDQSILEYDQGKFDAWCVYLTRSNNIRYAPRDPEYFSFLFELSKHFQSDQIYKDFVVIYDLTTSELSETLLAKISTLSKRYREFSLNFDIWLTAIYAGMVAEENKVHTKLGKKVKRLGIHQVLIEGIPPNDAANFSRGKKWFELEKLCKERGF